MVPAFPPRRPAGLAGSAPDRTTCAYGRDTDREIERRECARPFGPSARFCA